MEEDLNDDVEFEENKKDHITYHDTIDETEDINDLSNFMLNRETLDDYGNKASRLREDYEARARLLDEEDKDFFHFGSNDQGIPPKRIFEKLSRRPRGLMKNKVNKSSI